MQQRLVRGAPLALASLAFIVGGCVLNFAATAGGAPVSLVRAANSCDITQSKSLSGTVKTQIKFVNKTSGVVKIYWLDYTGKRVYYATLPAGGSLNQATFDTHAWIVLDSSGTCIGYVVAPRTEYDILSAASTGGGGSGGTSGGETFTITVDAANQAVNESFNAYFPTALTVHPGDSVLFHYLGVGEPHTATFGTLADDAVSAYSKLSPAEQASPPADVIAADAKLPNVFPSGGGDAISSAANPCFLDSGLPSSTAPCPQSAQPDFTGTQSYFNSGWLAANARFTVHLSSSIAPGTYRFMCLVHREGMSGTITVVPKASAVPSPSADAATGAQQLSALEAKLEPAVKLLEQGKPAIPGASLPGPNAVLAGSAIPGSSAGEIDQFGPKTLHIPVGGTVTWWLTGDHSITFNATKANDDVRKVGANGKVHFNSAAIAPVGGKGQPKKPLKGGSKKHIKFAVVAAQSWNGKGFHNSGVFTNSKPPNIEGYKLTFTRAGTYHYICTVHDKMKGTIVVGS